MDIFVADLHPSFAEALNAVPSQRGNTVEPAKRGLFGHHVSEETPRKLPARLASAELQRIAGNPKNDPVIRSYFAAAAELVDRSDPTDELYLAALNDALDAYLRFDERQTRIGRAVQKMGTAAGYEKERSHLQSQIESLRDEVARQVPRNALDQLQHRIQAFDALLIDLERIEARKAMIAQRLAAVRELLILDSLNTGEATSEGSGLELLRTLNEELAKDAFIAQQAEAEHILQSITV